MILLDEEFRPQHIVFIIVANPDDNRNCIHHSRSWPTRGIV